MARIIVVNGIKIDLDEEEGLERSISDSMSENAMMGPEDYEEAAAYRERMRETDPMEEVGAVARDLSALVSRVGDLSKNRELDPDLRVALERVLNSLREADSDLADSL